MMFNNGNEILEDITYKMINYINLNNIKNFTEKENMNLLSLFSNYLVKLNNIKEIEVYGIEVKKDLTFILMIIFEKIQYKIIINPITIMRKLKIKKLYKKQSF
jgi:hypothetical protein